MKPSPSIIETPYTELTRRWVSVSDFVETATLCLLAIAAIFVPRRHWRKVATTMARLDRFARRKDCDDRRAHLLAIAGDDLDTEQVMLDGLADNVLIRLSSLRQNFFPNWRVPVKIDGGEHVERGLKAGHGVILWKADTVSSNHETYQALQDHGLETIQVARPTHGLSRSHFGIRWLNPIRQRIERRACADYVVIDRGSTRAGVSKLKGYLDQNQIVSIDVGDKASRVVCTPFANGFLRIAFGPMRIANEAGAVLLPLYTSGRVSDSIVLSIGPPLPLASLDDADAIGAAQTYVNWLTPLVEADPGAWRSWPIVQAAHSIQPAIQPAIQPSIQS